ncbi:N-acetyltransferase [Pseudoprevotella muciniphila]|uniref:N-acetyltransferase n=2 Tax=Pseudoprevotella muciniphila TaxID=2133944 RepID=A0A5P8EA33_9BACT|nr:N-acetyltransferase [Pseudoprevotella muciniphila]
MTRNDMQLICDMFNDTELEDVVVGWAFPLSIEQQNKWFDNSLSSNGLNHRFVIETKEDGSIGIATLTDIDWKNRTAIHGIKLANKQFCRRGIGTDTVMAIMRYAFDELGLHRLESCRFDSNAASKHLYSKCGWKEEGVKRECIYKHGVWRDLTMIGVLESDYKKLIEENHYWNL